MHRVAARAASIFVIALLAAACSSNGADSSGSSTTRAGADAGVTESAGVLTEFGDLPNAHIDPPFASEFADPPVGGDHYPFWHNCGFYSVELIDGAATHSLEHGVVWITYNPDVVSTDEVSRLRSLADENDRLLISPHGHAEGLVLSAWGAQLRGPESIDSTDAVSFIEERVDSSAAPEPGASCNGAAGVPPDDVRTLADGTPLPEVWS